MWKIGVEHFCLACHKRHTSTAWYYRPSVDGVLHEWLCGMKYHVLDPEETKLWQIIPMLQNWAKFSEHPTNLLPPPHLPGS